MPVYEYRCAAGHEHDHFTTVERRHEHQTCPHCGNAAYKVILHAPRVFGDYEGYESPATGRWVEGRRARVEDLRRSGCRPYEAGEREEAERRRVAADRSLDKQADVAVELALQELTS